MIFKLTKKFFKYFLYIIFSYFIIAFSTYTISAIFLVKDKILNYKVLINYQRNFYHQLGFRKIWQAQSECVDYDKELIYVPRIGKCLFKNPEFTTELNFTKEGRQTGNNLISDSKGVAVIGDSMAMGWGVNDNQTFASLLEKEIKVKVYNLAVSSYATERSIIRLKNSNLLKKIDTIIIQYCPNDYGENLTHTNKKEFDISKNKYEKIFIKEQSFLKGLRKIARYSFKIPFEVITFKRDQLSWRGHDTLFEEIISKYDFLKDKKIIVMSMNYPGDNFYDFPNDKSPKLQNIKYLDIKYEDEDFYPLDMHLNTDGHKKVAKILSKTFQKK